MVLCDRKNKILCIKAKLLNVLDLNAVTRSLDLGSKVLAPALVGLIMSVVFLMAGALF